MKAFLAVILGALLVSASALAAPANKAVDQALHGGMVVSTPETLGNYGSEALPVFIYDDPASDPVTISTPNTFGNGVSQQMPVFNYRGAVPVYWVSGSATTQNSGLFPSTSSLVNRTGDGH